MPTIKNSRGRQLKGAAVHKVLDLHWWFTLLLKCLVLSLLYNVAGPAQPRHLSREQIIQANYHKQVRETPVQIHHQFPCTHSCGHFLDYPFCWTNRGYSLFEESSGARAVRQDSWGDEIGQIRPRKSATGTDPVATVGPEFQSPGRWGQIWPVSRRGSPDDVWSSRLNRPRCQIFGRTSGRWFHHS